MGQENRGRESEELRPGQANVIGERCMGAHCLSLRDERQHGKEVASLQLSAGSSSNRELEN